MGKRPREVRAGGGPFGVVSMWEGGEKDVSEEAHYQQKGSLENTS